MHVDDKIIVNLEFNNYNNRHIIHQPLDITSLPSLVNFSCDQIKKSTNENIMLKIVTAVHWSESDASIDIFDVKFINNSGNSYTYGFNDDWRYTIEHIPSMMLPDILYLVNAIHL